MLHRARSTGLLQGEINELSKKCREVDLTEDIIQIAADAVLAYRRGYEDGPDSELAAQIGEVIATTLRNRTESSSEEEVTDDVRREVDCLLRCIHREYDGKPTRYFRRD